MSLPVLPRGPFLDLVAAARGFAWERVAARLGAADGYVVLAAGRWRTLIYSGSRN